MKEVDPPPVVTVTRVEPCTLCRSVAVSVVGLVTEKLLAGVVAKLTDRVSSSLEPLICTTGPLSSVPYGVTTVMLVMTGLVVASRRWNVPLSFNDVLRHVPPKA